MDLNVNGATHTVDDRHETTPLLWVLRDVLGLHAVKFGCGSGFCAACTVWVDGKATKSCQTAARRVVGKAVHTADAAEGPQMDALRSTWYRNNVIQCGYCQLGQLLAAGALLAQNPTPDDAAIDRTMNGNLCRCGTYPRIRSSIHEAAATLREGGAIDLVPRDDDRPLPVFDQSDPIGAYINIGSDGTVNVACSQFEMGQGTHTGLAAIVADELDADVAQVRVVHAGNASGRYDNPILGGGVQQTGDSTSTIVYWTRYRQVAAALRTQLVRSAARRWRVTESEISVSKGVVSDPSGRQAGFAELTGHPELGPSPADAVPKDNAEYRVIGDPTLRRVDSPAKIWGTARFAIDVEWPGLLTALVVHPPKFGAIVASVASDEARAMPGVVDIIEISNGVAVVAETFFDASNAARKLSVEWNIDGAETRGSEELRAEHLRLAAEAKETAVARDEGDVEDAMAKAARVIERITDTPYAAHAPLEPINAACRVREDGVLEVRVGTQSGDFARLAAAEASGLPEDRIDIQIAYAGGGFGLRMIMQDSPVSEAVEIAKSLGWKHAIKVLSSRTEEFRNGNFQPMTAVRTKVGLDDEGAIVAWDHRVVSQSISASLPVVGKTLYHDHLDIMQIVGAIDMPYSVPNHRVEAVDFMTAIPVTTWRSIGTYQNTFAIETMMDEIAQALHEDPVALRRRLLPGHPRARAVLDLAAERCGWDRPLGDGRARGFALSFGFRTYSAQVVEISLDDRGRLVVERITLVVDPGTLITPDLAKAQMEGGLVFGLSAALGAQITLREGEVVQQNFDGYPVLRFQGTPDMDIHFAPSGDAPGGLGEVAVPTVAPALANALAALRGERITTLPISKYIKVSPTAGRRNPPKPLAGTSTPAKEISHA
jgi:isoquinoline 1-oxidoreductase subunit beta